MEDEIIERLKLKIAISEIKKESDISMKKKRNLISKKIGIAACACIMLISGFAYAKDIENYFKSLFNNSTKAIDIAVENGYVQKEEMDFVYDKDIGVKVDNLIIDDLNLAISFNFKTKNEDIKSIRFNDFTITNDNDKVVYRSEFKSAETLDELPIYNSVNWMNEPEKLTDTIFTDSIIFGLRAETEEFKELFFDIKSIDLTYINDEREIIEGNWKFDVEINEEMRKNTTVKYTLLEENEYVKSATATLSPTGMYLNLKLKQPMDYKSMSDKADRGELTVDEMDGFILKNNNKIFRPSLITGGGYINDKGITDTSVEYENISFFEEKFDEFEVYIVQFDSTITLVKEEN